MSAMCGVQLKDRKISTDLMSILGLNTTMDHLAMANSVLWHGHVLRRENGLLLRRVFDLAVERQRKKRRPKRTWKKHIEDRSVNVC